MVNDAKSGEDITRGVLAQIIFEEEAKGQNMLPANFLRSLIRLYGDTLQGSCRAISTPRWRPSPKPGADARAGAARVRGQSGAGELRGAGAVEHGVVRAGDAHVRPLHRRHGGQGRAPAAKSPKKDVELDELKAQLAEMQAQLAKLVKDS